MTSDFWGRKFSRGGRELIKNELTDVLWYDVLKWIQIILNLYRETSTNLNFNTQARAQAEYTNN